MTIARHGGQYLRPVGKKKSVADIKENHTPFCHLFILLKASAGAGKQPVSLYLGRNLVEVTDPVAAPPP
jgi:hypothetical protein